MKIKKIVYYPSLHFNFFFLLQHKNKSYKTTKLTNLTNRQDLNGQLIPTLHNYILKSICNIPEKQVSNFYLKIPSKLEFTVSPQ